MAKWGRGSKVPGYGRLLSKFDQSFSYSGGLIESCPKPGTFDHLPPFAIHILNPLDMRNHRDPLFMGQKCTQYGRETNTSQVFGNCGSLSPPPTLGDALKEQEVSTFNSISAFPFSFLLA